MLPDHPINEVALIGEIDFLDSINEAEVENKKSRFNNKKLVIVK